MSADQRDLLGYAVEHRRHQLGVRLIGGVVAELTKALVVQRLPYDLVEQLAFLADARAHRVQVVLCADDLGTGGIFVGVEIHPVGRIAQGVRR